MFLFLNLFKNSSLQDNRLESLGFDKILRIDFSNPGCITNLDQIKPILMDVLAKYSYNGMLKDAEQTKAINLYKSIKFENKIHNSLVIKKQLKDQLSDVFKIVDVNEQTEYEK